MAEIAVGSNSAEAHVTVWSAKSGELLNSFYAYGQNDGGPAFKGGVRVGLVAYAQQEVDAGPSSLPRARVLVTGAGPSSFPTHGSGVSACPPMWKASMWPRLMTREV